MALSSQESIEEFFIVNKAKNNINQGQFQNLNTEGKLNYKT